MIRTSHYTIFDSPLGACGLVWGEQGILAVLLPERSEGELRHRLAQSFPGATHSEPPASVRTVAGRIVALLEGRMSDFGDVLLDMGGLSPFRRRVYEAARRIPPGKTLSYGELAARLGKPAAARAVGHALGRNPFALVVPCHRVLGRDGQLRGFSAEGGVSTKRRLLELEGALPAPRATP